MHIYKLKMGFQWLPGCFLGDGGDSSARRWSRAATDGCLGTTIGRQ